MKYILSIEVYLTFALLLANTIIIFKKKKTLFGREIAKVFFFGLLLCIVAAVRDDYATATPLIPINGMVSTLLTLLGLSLAVMAISSVFVRSQKYRKTVFIAMNVIFICKFIIMEIVRLISLL
jgi:hypothetical protein